MTTPVIQIKTEHTLAIFKESCPSNAPKKRVKRPDVDVNTVVLATLVFASAEFERYCMTANN